MTNINDIKLSLPENIVDSGYFTENDLRVLDALLFFNASEYAKSNGEFFTTNQRLRKQAEIKNNPTLYRALKKFNDHGFITRTPGKEGEASVYIIHDDAIQNFNKTKGKMNRSKKTPVTNAKNMLPTLNTNELRVIIEELVTPLSNRVTKLEEEIANLLKISMGNQNATVTDQNERNSLRISMGNQNEDGGNKNDLVTTETETDTEKETDIENVSLKQSNNKLRNDTCNYLACTGDVEKDFSIENEIEPAADASARSTDAGVQSKKNTSADRASTCPTPRSCAAPPSPTPKEYSVRARRQVTFNGQTMSIHPYLADMLSEGADLIHRLDEEGVFNKWNELKLSIDRGALQQDPTGRLSEFLINMFNKGATPVNAPKEYVMQDPTEIMVTEQPLSIDERMSLYQQ